MDYCICICPILDNTGTDASNICKVCHKPIQDNIYPTDVDPNVTTYVVNVPDQKCPCCGK